jgi:hypothetical protein
MKPANKWPFATGAALEDTLSAQKGLDFREPPVRT